MLRTLAQPTPSVFRSSLQGLDDVTTHLSEYERFQQRLRKSVRPFQEHRRGQRKTHSVVLRDEVIQKGCIVASFELQDSEQANPIQQTTHGCVCAYELESASCGRCQIRPCTSSPMPAASRSVTAARSSRMCRLPSSSSAVTARRSALVPGARNCPITRTVAAQARRSITVAMTTPRHRRADPLLRCVPRDQAALCGSNCAQSARPHAVPPWSGPDLFMRVF